MLTTITFTPEEKNQTLTHFDDQNPYEPGTEEFSQWEQGWQHWVNEQWKQLQQEEEEKNPQQRIDF